MKYFILSIVASVILFSCQEKAPEGFVLEATVSNGEGMVVRLDDRVNKEWVNIDSAVITDGKFRLEGMVESPKLLYLKFMEEGGFRYINIFVENKTYKLDGDVDFEDDIVVTGSEINDLFNAYNNGVEQIYEPFDTLAALLRETEDPHVRDSIQRLLEALDDAETKYTAGFVNEHADSPVAAWVALRNLTYTMGYEELKEVADKFTSAGQANSYITELGETLEKMKKFAKGEIAPDFVQKDTSGVDFSSSSLRGKYVLLDFWASWCGPCRLENPNVVSVYNDYGGDRFEILGISLDRDKDAWLKAIEDDGLRWYHVSDLQYWQNEVAKMYNVNAIPANYLLDPEGRILARNLRGDDLRAKLEELLPGDAQ